ITGAYASAGFGGYNSGIITNCSTTCILLSTTNNSYGAFLGVSSSGRLEGNEYNSEINNGVQPVGRGLNNPTDKQILDNKELTASEMEKKYRGESSTEFNLQVGINDDEHSSISVDTGFELGSFAINISTEKGARAAIDKIDKLISKIYTKQTELGAVSNRLTSSMEYQSIQKSANIATNSVVKDADYAKESSNYIKSQILQNTTASLLSTANQNPNIALMLLNNKKH
ncbi:hypothetical protein IKE67_06420, partial [bacterium]|nr:hypothetical protein [bacterium]